MFVWGKKDGDGKGVEVGVAVMLMVLWGAEELEAVDSKE